MNSDHIDLINALCSRTSAIMSLLIDAYGSCSEEDTPNYSRAILCNLFDQIDHNVNEARTLVNQVWEASREAKR